MMIRYIEIGEENWARIRLKKPIAVVEIACLDGILQHA